MILNFMLYRLCKQMAIRKKYRVFLLRCTIRRFCKAKFMSRETSGNFKLWMHFTNGSRACKSRNFRIEVSKANLQSHFKSSILIRNRSIDKLSGTEKTLPNITAIKSINHFYSLKEKTKSNICHFSKFCIHTLKKSETNLKTIKTVVYIFHKLVWLLYRFLHNS